MKKYWIFGILIAVIFAGGWYFAWRDDDKPANDPNLVISDTLEDITFCGKTYQSKQVYIQRVNITQRIAELASEIKGENAICINIGYSTVSSKVLPMEVKISEGKYFISMVDLYKIDPLERTIHLGSAYEGTFKTLLGHY